MIAVSLLGPPRVERDGRRVAFETRKALALLALLALAERPRTRDGLADMLWPDQDPERARGALRRTLSDLRSGIGPDLLEANHDQVRLVTGPQLSVDVVRFRELAARGRLGEAVDLFGGDFVEGLAVRGAPRFEEWVEAQSDALRRELVAALAVLTEERAATGDLLAAMRLARRWVEADALHEPAHRALIRLFAATGDRAAALEQYRLCVAILSEELGVEPLPETTDLVEAVRRGEVEPVRPAPATHRPGAVLLTPFVGRAEQLAAARAVYEGVEAGGRVLLVEGEAGIGKTRFVEELLVGVRRRGGQVLTGRAYEDEAGLAYAPVVGALAEAARRAASWRHRVDAPALAEAARLVAELDPAATRVAWPGSGPGAEARFVGGVWATLIAATTGDAPGALFVDDVQCADDASLALLGYGLRRLADHPVLLVVTSRSPFDHPFRRAVATTARTGRGAVVTLGRLDEQEVAALVRATGVTPDDPAVVRGLWERTEGVPLLLVEYLRSGVDAAELPEGIRDILRARLGPLSPVARQVASAAAVLGRSFDTGTVRAVSGRTDDETVTALEDLVRHGVVREGAAAYDFAHDMVRTLAYEETSLARRRLLHGRAAQVRGLSPAAAARHLQLADRTEEAAEAFRAAADEARSVYANTEAIEHYRAALALGHPARAGLLMDLADLLVVTGNYPAALQALEDAAAEAEPGERPAVEERFGRLRLRGGEYAAAEDHLQKALAGVPDSEVARRAGLLADLSMATQARGDAGRARASAEQADRVALESGDRRALCRTQNLLGVLATDEGDLTTAVRHLERSRELADELDDVDLQVAALNNLALARRVTGDLDRATALTRRSLELCTAIGDRHQEAALRNNLADLLHASGQAEEAMAQLKRAVTIFAEIGQEDAPQPGVWRLTRW